MNKRYLVALIIICLIAVSAGFFYQKESSAQQTVGAILPLTGQLAPFGEKVRDGLRLYELEHPNVKIVIEDDGGQSKGTLNAFSKLSSLHDIHLIVGPFGPTSSETLYASFDDEQISDTLLIAISMCSDNFKDYINMLCSYPSPLYQINKSFQFLSKEKKQSIAIMVSNDAFGQSIAEAFEQGAKNNNLTSNGVVTVNALSQQFYTEASKAISKNTDAIIVSTPLSDTVIRVVKALKERGYEGLILIATDINEDIAREFGETLEGVYSMGLPKLEFQNEFFESYRAMYGKDPDLYASYGYLLPQILVSSEPETVTDILQYTQSHSPELPIAGIHFNEQKQIELPMLIYQIENGSLVEKFIAR